MKLSAEITLYPLQDDYLPAIKGTIDKLNSYSNITVNTFPTATILVGDYQIVMSAIQEVVAWSYTTFGKCIFITKFIPDYEAQ